MVIVVVFTTATTGDAASSAKGTSPILASSPIVSDDDTATAGALISAGEVVALASSRLSACARNVIVEGDTRLFVLGLRSRGSSCADGSA